MASFHSRPSPGRVAHHGEVADAPWQLRRCRPRCGRARWLGQGPDGSRGGQDWAGALRLFGPGCPCDRCSPVTS
eukprot:508854-Alexandrium_andersonii.AAC.1